MIVADSIAYTVQPVRWKAHTVEAFHRRLLAGSVLPLCLIQIPHGLRAEESVTEVLIDSFNEICNRRGEAVSRSGVLVVSPFGKGGLRGIF